MKNSKAIVFYVNLLISSLVIFSCQEEDPFINTPPVIEDQAFTIGENLANDTMIDTVVATDADKKQTLKYYILSGNFDEAFKIDSLTGVLYINNSEAVNYELRSTFELAVMVKDDYEKSLSSSAQVTISIQNVIEVNIPTNGLVAYYPFNGNANDESGNNHNGTLYGATLTTDRHHRANGAYEFDGVNDYINTFSTFDYNYRTISLWVNPCDIHGTSPNNHTVIVQDSPLNIYGAVIIFFADGLLGMNPGGSANTDVFLPNNLVENIWYHLVLVRNGSQNLCYINGILVNTCTSSDLASTFESNQLFVIGTGRSTTKQFFNGKIDEIAIYDRVLSQEEIITLNNYK